ncbi:MAG TPA: PKD domain-containing protein [Candidatus Bathyarchaeia archaeon]
MKLNKVLIAMIFSLILTGSHTSVLTITPNARMSDSPSTELEALGAPLILLGAGAKWAAGNGTRALYIGLFENLLLHPNALLPDPFVFQQRSVLVKYVLELYGLDVNLAGDIPVDLSGYDVVVIDAYWACEPSNKHIVKNYLANGGGLVLVSGVPCYFAAYSKDLWPGNDLSLIQEWLGASLYGNFGGGYATVGVDNPVGATMLAGDSLGFFTGPALAALEELDEDSILLAAWGTGQAFSFVHEYGQGRLYYQADYRPPRPPVADFSWSPSEIRVGEPETFDASLSQPAWNGTHATTITEYQWDFGDGNTTSSADPTISHTYASPDWFSVTLTVFDSEGSNASCSNIVWVTTQVFLSISTSSASTFVGFTVGINGTLSDLYGNGLANELVVLYYTFEGAYTWFQIISDVTDALGNYYAQWIPTATGTFTIIAEWRGNMTHNGETATVTLSSLPYMNQYIFTVESNSTVSALEFNTTSSELRFTVAGTSGTNGFVKVTIAKSLLENPENIKVFLGGNQIEYSLTSADNSWLLTFNYEHSIHQVTISLGNMITEITSDLNDDGKVDIIDLTVVAVAFDATKGDVRYNARADVNKDGEINIVDIAIVATDFQT